MSALVYANHSITCLGKQCGQTGEAV